MKSLKIFAVGAILTGLAIGSVSAADTNTHYRPTLSNNQGQIAMGHRNDADWQKRHDERRRVEKQHRTSDAWHANAQSDRNHRMGNDTNHVRSAEKYHSGRDQRNNDNRLRYENKHRDDVRHGGND